MRILFVVSYYKPAYIYGGPVKSISSMCEGLARSGVEVTVLTTNANGKERTNVPLGEPVDILGVQVIYSPVLSGLPRSFFYSPQLVSIFTQKILEYDLVVLDTFFTHAMGPTVSYCLRNGKPYIIPLRGQLLPWAMNHKRLKKWLYLNILGRGYLNRATALHCTVPVEVETLKPLGIKTPAFVVPNGVEADRWVDLPERGVLRKRLGITDDEFVLLVVGRLHPIKRPDIALSVLASLSRSGVHLIYAGPDETGMKARLIARSKQLGVAERVHFMGLLTGIELLQVFSDADLLVMPSATENFGMAAVEAMAAGLPVVVSKNVPVGIWAEEAGAGFCVENTVEDFTNSILGLLKKPEDFKTMGEKGRELVRRKLDINIVVHQMIRQYQAIIKDGQPLIDAGYLKNP